MEQRIRKKDLDNSLRNVKQSVASIDFYLHKGFKYKRVPIEECLDACKCSIEYAIMELRKLQNNISVEHMKVNEIKED